MRFTFLPRLAGLLLIATLAACATPADNRHWPVTTVSVEQMKLLTPVRIRYIQTSNDISGVLTTVLRVHVDAEGKTVRSRVEQSSGHARVDEAALLAMQDTRFAPYAVDGVAQPVTLILPMHVPVKKL